MRTIILAITLLSLTGCITPMINYHSDYCNKFTPDERSAFRVLSGNTVKINCDDYL